MAAFLFHRQQWIKLSVYAISAVIKSTITASARVYAFKLLCIEGANENKFSVVFLVLLIQSKSKSLQPIQGRRQTLRQKFSH